MKKLINIAFFMILAINIFPQSLQDYKDYFNKGIELLDEAKKSYDSGEYDKGYEYSEQSKEYFKKANLLYIIYNGTISINRQKEVATKIIERLNASNVKNYPEANAYYEKTINLFNEGESNFQNGNATDDFNEKARLFENSLNNFNDSINHGIIALRKIPKETTNNDISDDSSSINSINEAKQKRKMLIDEKILKTGSDDDKVIQGMINKASDELKNKNYKQAKSNAEQAIAYMDDSILEKTANKLLQEASEKLTNVKQTENEINKDKIKNAENLFDDSKANYDSKNYLVSIKLSRQVIEALSNLNSEEIVLPKYYIVRLIPNNRDCFWKIAAYKFVYNNKHKWKFLYEANKEKLRNKNNPHLIFPDIILEIPSISGEKREGYYDSTKNYSKVMLK